MEKKSWWVKNTDGKPDAMLTFALFSFIVITINVFLSTFGVITVGDVTMQFEALDSSVMAVYLGSTFTAYVSRKWTDRKFLPDSGKPEAKSGGLKVGSSSMAEAEVLDSEESTTLS